MAGCLQHILTGEAVQRRWKRDRVTLSSYIQSMRVLCFIVESEAELFILKNFEMNASIPDKPLIIGG